MSAEIIKGIVAMTWIPATGAATAKRTIGSTMLLLVTGTSLVARPSRNLKVMRPIGIIDGDGKRSDTPELLLCVSGERKVPSCTMNATEDDRKGHHEEGVRELGIFVTSTLWNIYCRNVLGGSREGS